MTLEQIQNRQQTINYNLTEISDNLSTMADYLGGENLKEAKKATEPSYSGLIGNIEDSQKTSEQIISDIYESYRRLYDQVYTPKEVQCVIKEQPKLL